MTKETFFIQIPPGLEDLAKKEFLLKFAAISPDTVAPQPVVEAGGFTIELPLELGVKLNFWLKIPNRILLRITQFKCRDLPKLFNKVSKLPLANYYAGQEFQFHISSTQSRLFDSRRIEKTLKEALAQNLKRQAPKMKAKDRAEKWDQWRFYCRFQNDQCEISIDTSGERLGKRGQKTKVGRAPLRENLAAALFFATIEAYTTQADKNLLLVDPFAGSGTILTESAHFFKPNLARNFSFSFFPYFLGKEAVIQEPHAPELEDNSIFVAGERSEQQYQALEENLSSIKYNHCHSLMGDSFDGGLKKVITQLNSNGEVAICMTNPPYGKRIQTDAKIKISELLEKIFSLFPFQMVGILMPKEYALPTNKYHLVDKLNFSHGGTLVTYSIWTQMN